MADPLKSAYEVALDRLRSLGDGEGAAAELSEKQKAEITAAREEFRAPRSELRFRHEQKMAGLPEGEEAVEAREQARASFEAGIAALDEEEEATVRRIREGQQRD